MKSFPDFMKHPTNAIAPHSQSTGVAGYVFDGADGSQMAFWECHADGCSSEHTHNFDEYIIVIDGCYVLIIEGHRKPIRAGQEYVIPKGVPHSGEFVEGTRTIHAFGGKRAERKGS
jgi:quercetin dioxygenase-like cupin family protein